MFGWLGGKRGLAETRSLGARAVKQIAETWLVDKDRIEWVHNGFDWWPGSFRVAVRYQGGSDPDRWRVSVATDFVEDVPVDERRFTQLTSTVGLFASSYSYVYLTERMAARLKARRSNSLYLFSSAYISPDLMGWLPAYLARVAILQPIDAEIRARVQAELFGGRPAFAPETRIKREYDEMLDVVKDAYAPAGERPNWWNEAGALEEFVQRETVGEDGMTFLTASEEPVRVSLNERGLLLVAVFNDQPARIALRCTERHPQLGNGLRVTVQLPALPNQDQAVEHAASLNFLEAETWTGFPQLGCWATRETEQGGQEIAHASFIPNALSGPGIAENYIYWSLARVKWAEQMLKQQHRH
jgi:hypothetical protein